MTEDSVVSTVSSTSSAADNNNNGNNNSGSQTRQRKKRKWDEPAETIVSAAVAVPGFVPLGTVGSLPGVSLPGVPAVSGALLTNTVAARCAISSPAFQVPSVTQGIAATLVPKQNQLNIQDELIIAREIVINDAESSVRYKLTKRQTQEEIQKCTGAVVITRGKYHPPNAPSDGEKPLYLHISAGAHLKDTAERILAVDRAAAMVEEMIIQGQNSQPTTFQPALSNGVKALSTCVFLGFDADPSLNIAARIQGPNDQYINHIMNETGSSVILRGRGSGNSESLTDTQQPLHLFLSASNSKSLEDAKRLAENLLDTISLECGASRVSSCKVYSAVPAPPQLLAGVHSSGNEHTVITSSAPGLTTCTPTIPASSVAGLGFTHPFPQGTTCGQPQTNLVSYPQPLVTKGTSYTGYGGIYPQATPLQQVAQALIQSSSPIVSTVGPATSAASTASKPSTSSISDKENRSTPKRKFKELPISLKGPANAHQGSELVKHGEEPLVDLGPRSISTMPAPVKLVQQSTNGMTPPPHRTMPPLPPPPKFTSAATPKKLVQPSSRDMPPPPSRTMSLTPPPKFTSASPVTLHGKNSVSEKTKAIPDTLFKLMEYGEDDDDDLEESSEESSNDNSNTGVRKPFWAV